MPSKNPWGAEELAYVVSRHRYPGVGIDRTLFQWPSKFPLRTQGTVRKYYSRLAAMPENKLLQRDQGEEFRRKRRVAQAFIDDNGGEAAIVRRAERGGMRAQTGKGQSYASRRKSKKAARRSKGARKASKKATVVKISTASKSRSKARASATRNVHFEEIVQAIATSSELQNDARSARAAARAASKDASVDASIDASIDDSDDESNFKDDADITTMTSEDVETETKAVLLDAFSNFSTPDLEYKVDIMTAYIIPAAIIMRRLREGTQDKGMNALLDAHFHDLDGCAEALNGYDGADSKIRVAIRKLYHTPLRSRSTGRELQKYSSFTDENLLQALKKQAKRAGSKAVLV